VHIYMRKELTLVDLILRIAFLVVGAWLLIHGLKMMIPTLTFLFRSLKIEFIDGFPTIIYFEFFFSLILLFLGLALINRGIKEVK